MAVNTIRWASVVVLILCLGCGPTEPETPTVGPGDAAEFILDAFQRHPIVALDEGDHQSRQFHDFLIDLMRHPRFTSVVDDVAVEFANARLQDRLDAYVSGAEVDEPQLTGIWRDTTQMLTWDSPVYRRFFEAAREVNRSHPERRLRVLAGDPPIDWSQVRGHEDVMRFSDRDGHFADVLEREVMAKGRKALVVAGGGHLYRDDPECCNLVQILERSHPGKLLVIKTHDPQSEAAEPYVAGWPRPAIARLEGTELGALEAGLLIGVFEGGKQNLQEVADAYLYLTPFDQMEKVRPDPAVYQDASYTREIERRYQLIFQEPFPQEVWRQLKGGP